MMTPVALDLESLEKKLKEIREISKMARDHAEIEKQSFIAREGQKPPLVPSRCQNIWFVRIVVET